MVAGGTGRLGVLVVQRLVDLGHEVRVMTRDPARARQIEGVEVVTADVRSPTSVFAAMAGIDLVVSAVHGFVGPRGISPASVDRDGNIHLVDAAQSVGAAMVMMSTVGASAESAMELFRMKYAAEHYLRASGVPSTIVRSSAFVELWIELLRQTSTRSGRPLVFGDGRNPINFVSVGDVAAVVVHAINDKSTRGRTLEVGGPDNLTFDQLAQAVQHSDGRTGSPRHVPRAALKVIANTVGRLKPELGRQARAALVMDRADLTFDAELGRQAFPTAPRSTVADVLRPAQRSPQI